VLWALSEVSTHFPFPETPDFVISLGTGEPGLSNYETSTEDCRSVRNNGILQRLCHVMTEKTRDKTVRRAYNFLACTEKIARRIHRLNIDFNVSEPRLDDTKGIPGLVSQVLNDSSLLPKVKVIARCMIASLFYFELDSLPQRYNGEYTLLGHISCTLRRSDPALEALLEKLAESRAKFLINGCPAFIMSDNHACLGGDGNFRVKVGTTTTDSLSITLEVSSFEACNISGSPFSVQRLVTAQGFDAVFGRPDHRKRKRSRCGGELAIKRKKL
jgi:hypothetical protein